MYVSSSISSLVDNQFLFSARSSLCQIWKQLTMIEDALQKKNFKSLDLTTSRDIESLFTITPLSFIYRLGICPESDIFDPESNYVGFLIYLYDNKDEFTVNQHKCKCGQLFIRKQKNIFSIDPILSYRKTSFSPLFMHESLYDFYFKEKPSERFHGIGFIYEHGRWKFDLIIYAGQSGIHSAYDDPKDSSIVISRAEQDYFDLVLSALYVNNKWKNDMGCMYTIDELESIGRELFREKIKIIKGLFREGKEGLGENVQIALEELIRQYEPKESSKVNEPMTKVSKNC